MKIPKQYSTDKQKLKGDITSATSISTIYFGKNVNKTL